MVPSNLWAGKDDVDDTHIEAYHHFLHSEDAHSYLPSVAKEISRAEQYLQNHEPTSDEPESAHEEQEEWM